MDESYQSSSLDLDLVLDCGSCVAVCPVYGGETEQRFVALDQVVAESFDARYGIEISYLLQIVYSKDCVQFT